ncbi:MAG: metallophosphoesterase family protein [Pseudomonadota bacterium]
MFDSLRNIFGSRPDLDAPAPCVPDGTRYYVIGDIHGRLDLFEALIDAIEADDEQLPKADTRMILLGDLVDRGPDSAGVIERARQWQCERNVRVLAGNHEEMFLNSFARPDILRHFLKHGGRETIMSYGLSKKQYAEMSLEELFEAILVLVPQGDLEYIEGFEDYIVAGDYMFVHAGIDPAVPIEEQKRGDLLWIRDRFLNYGGAFEKVVVHGHTISETVVDRGNRVGIDTGAFRSGVLTALVLEGDQRRVIQTAQAEGGDIEISGYESAG